MDAEEKVITEKIQKLMEDLEKYCHKPGCDDWWDCPFNHKNCRGRLNTATAIAWELANSFHCILSFGVFSESANSYVTEARTLLRVCERMQLHSKTKRFPELERIVSKVIHLVNDSYGKE